MWLSQRNIKLLPWPAQSPDISPIENIWDVIQRQINERMNLPSNLEELKLVVLEEWEMIPEQTLKHLIEGMPRKITAVRLVKGYQTVLKVEITRLSKDLVTKHPTNRNYRIQV